jgi:acetyl esterase/lipase
MEMKLMIAAIFGLLTALRVVAQAPSDQSTPPAAVPAGLPSLMSPDQFKALPSKPADYRFSYGADANQFGELRVPSGAGPYPVAILIHGGCFKAEYGTLRDLAPIADALKAKGIATWSIEYRRLGQAGSGWPGTYLDVGRGVDYLRSIAVQNHLDLSRVIVVGHSAGGHLAMWVAARSRLPKTSPIFVSDPLTVRGVVDLAGTPDLEALIPAEQRSCGGPVIEQLLGGSPSDVPDHYAQASATRMLPIGVPQALFWGRRDDNVPISIGENYARMAEHSGDSARLVTFAQAGHFELADPFFPTWPTIEKKILSLLVKRP